jgi:hypothetical protein
VVATVVVALDDEDVAPAADALLLTELLAAVVVVLAFVSLQTVSVPVFALRTRPGAIASWASPCVTLWTFSLTSPSELEMRTTPALGG